MCIRDSTDTDTHKHTQTLTHTHIHNTYICTHTHTHTDRQTDYRHASSKQVPEDGDHTHATSMGINKRRSNRCLW